GPEGRRYALLRCQIETGRQHQIRAHLQAEGFPIVGDKIYGHDETAFIRFTEGVLTERDLAMLRLPRHALHASKIGFEHPETGERVEVEAPLPSDLCDFLESLTTGEVGSRQS
ncbi:MAG: RluA family pseudouridine synthase, partial [Myxococcota bacterium]